MNERDERSHMADNDYESALRRSEFVCCCCFLCQYIYIYLSIRCIINIYFLMPISILFPLFLLDKSTSIVWRHTDGLKRAEKVCGCNKRNCFSTLMMVCVIFPLVYHVSLYMLYIYVQDLHFSYSLISYLKIYLFVC